MAILSVQDEFQSGDNVTATNLNNLVNQANFVDGASNTTDDSTLEVHTSGYLKVKNNGVGDEHLQQMTDAEATTAGNDNGRAVTTNHIRNDAVTTAKIENNAVTYAKMQNVSATDRVLGRDSAGAGNVEEITPSALRTMINVEDGATADQTGAEMKTAIGNATTSASGLMSSTDKTTLDGLVSNATHTGDVTGSTELTIANDAVTSAKIADGAVTSAKIANNAVGSSEIANNAVGSSEIADDAVTFAKMTNISTATVIGRTSANTGDPELVAIKDEDSMASNSATALATQQSIKAYVDAQIAANTAVSKYDSGWVNQDNQTSPTSLANNATLTFTHSLGTAPVCFRVFLASNSSGANPFQADGLWVDTNNNRGYGCQATNITSNSITIKCSTYGVSKWTGGLVTGTLKNFGGTDATHIRVVAIG
jgi:hypothetical protein